MLTSVKFTVSLLASLHPNPHPRAMRGKLRCIHALQLRDAIAELACLRHIELQ